MAVAVLTEDQQQRTVLERQIEATHVARIVLSDSELPLDATDPVLQQIRGKQVEITIIDVSPLGVFAVCEMLNPAHIVSAMRAGAVEVLDRAPSRTPFWKP